jgi:hypothetical protein
VLGAVGKLPEIFTELEISYFLLRRLLGVKAEAESGKQSKVAKLSKSEILMVNIGSTSTGGRILVWLSRTESMDGITNGECYDHRRSRTIWPRSCLPPLCARRRVRRSHCPAASRSIGGM